MSDGIQPFIDWLRSWSADPKLHANDRSLFGASAATLSALRADVERLREALSYIAELDYRGVEPEAQRYARQTLADAGLVLPAIRPVSSEGRCQRCGRQLLSGEYWGRCADCEMGQ